MADHLRVVVYVPAHYGRLLRRYGHEPAEWVRQAVRREFLRFASEASRDEDSPPRTP